MGWLTYPLRSDPYRPAPVHRSPVRPRHRGRDVPSQTDRTVRRFEGELDHLRPGTYQLRLTKVSLDHPRTPEATYVAADRTSRGSVPLDEPQSFEVAVRDKYGNPVTDASLALSVTRGSGRLPKTTVTTDHAGVARFSVTPTRAGPLRVQATLDNGSPTRPYERTTFTMAPGGGGGGASRQLAIYTSGQMYRDLGTFDSLTLKDGRLAPSTGTDCLLVGDTGGGLVGGVLAGLQCDLESFQTLQGSVELDARSETYTVTYAVFDQDGDGNVAEGDDGAIVRIDSDGSSTDGGVFHGELTNGAAQRMLTSGGVDVLDSSNYASTDWDPDVEGPFEPERDEDGYTSFDDLEFREVSSLFVNDAAGRVTAEPE